jgi:4-amino-4-deoxy-L-arabinose transferase-like glycosyltransferase
MSRNQRFLRGILVCALLLRLCALIFFPQPIQGDSPGYDRIARNFLSGRGFVEDNGMVAHRTPLYPFMLAVLFMFFNHNFQAVYLVQILMDVLCVYVTYRIAQTVFGNEMVGLYSALFYAFYPTFIVNAITLLTETLFTLLFLSSVFMSLRALDTQSVRYFFASGLALAGSALCRPVTLGFIPFFLVYVFYNVRTPHLLKRVFLVMVTTVAFFVAVVPWGIRNYRLLNVFVPSTTSVGHHFFYAQTPIVLDQNLWGETTYPMYYKALEKLDQERLDTLPEAEADKQLKMLAVQVIRAHPFQYAFISVNRLLRLWLNVGYGYQPSLFAWVICFGQIGILISAFYAWVFLPGLWRKRYALLVLSIVYITLVHSFVHAAYRYVVPVMPFVLMLSAYTCVRLWTPKEKLLNATTAGE